MGETAMVLHQQVELIPVTEIKPNPNQPRKSFVDESIIELSESIRKYGVLQPVLVRKVDGEGYELIAGERRLRACKKIERPTIPAIVTEATDDESTYFSVIENIQREGLSELDEAYMYSVLVDKEGVRLVAENLGKSTTYVEDRLTLLKLSEEVQRLFAQRKLNIAQAKVLAEIGDPNEQLKQAKLAHRLQLSANQLKGRTQHVAEPGAGNRHGHGSGNGGKRVSFGRLQSSVINLFDFLEAMDPQKFSEEQQNTLEDHFENLIEALKEARVKLSPAKKA